MAASLATPEHENGANLPSIRPTWDMIDVLFGDLDPVRQTDLGLLARTPECLMR
jgi:hypothetical protein